MSARARFTMKMFVTDCIDLVVVTAMTTWKDQRNELILAFVLNDVISPPPRSEEREEKLKTDMIHAPKVIIFLMKWKIDSRVILSFS
jgi:hypothetical protein